MSDEEVPLDEYDGAQLAAVRALDLQTKKGPIRGYQHLVNLLSKAKSPDEVQSVIRSWDSKKHVALEEPKIKRRDEGY